MQDGTKPLATGAQLGAYRIEALVGAGGMGEVYRARDTRFDRDVAIKVLPALRALADRDRGRRFLQEARAASALNHPHIVTLQDIGHEAGTRLPGDGVRPRQVARPAQIREKPPAPSKRSPIGLQIAARWPPRTRRASSIATSSRRTS